MTAIFRDNMGLYECHEVTRIQIDYNGGFYIDYNNGTEEHITDIEFIAIEI